MSAQAYEPWRWGDLFELDVPADLAVRDLGDAIELEPVDRSEASIHLAVLSPLTTPPERSVRDAIGRFAASHGLEALPPTHLEVRAEVPGVATGRLAFVVKDSAWLVLAVAWNQSLVLTFATAAGPSDPIFDQAEALLATLRPFDVVSDADLPPETSGDF
ncbi:MAG: hypothetical protein U1F43_02990 [Myxococcota bacterium]